jgi:hypothetical protein
MPTKVAGSRGPAFVDTHGAQVDANLSLDLWAEQRFLSP